VSLSLEQFLNQTAKRGSWYGGGSAAALTCAVSAALLEKLVSPVAGSRRGSAPKPSPVAGSLRATRRQVAALVQRDAQAFARVIKAYYQQDKAAIRRSLKEATQIPLTIAQAAGRVLAVSRGVKAGIKPRYRSDLTCVEALAKAARTGAEAFVETNLAWLNEPRYTQQVRRQLARTALPSKAIARARV